MDEQPAYKERALLELISRGKYIAFTKLFAHHKDNVYSVALHLSKSALPAGEIVQNVFVKIWTAREKLPEMQDFSAYLFIITRNDVHKVIKAIAQNYTITLNAGDDDALAADTDTAHGVSESNTRHAWGRNQVFKALVFSFNN